MDMTNFTKEEQEIIDRCGDKEPEDLLQQVRCDFKFSEDFTSIISYRNPTGSYVAWEHAKQAVFLTKYRTLRDWEKLIKRLRIIEIMMFVAIAVNLIAAFIHFIR